MYHLHLPCVITKNIKTVTVSDLLLLQHCTANFGVSRGCRPAFFFYQNKYNKKFDLICESVHLNGCVRVKFCFWLQSSCNLKHTILSSICSVNAAKSPL